MSDEVIPGEPRHLFTSKDMALSYLWGLSTGAGSGLVALFLSWWLL